MSNAISLTDYRAAKVAKVKCSRPRIPLSDAAEERLQSGFKRTEKAATREERVFFAIALFGCGWLMVALAVHAYALLT